VTGGAIASTKYCVPSRLHTVCSNLRKRVCQSNSDARCTSIDEKIACSCMAPGHPILRNLDGRGECQECDYKNVASPRVAKTKCQPSEEEDQNMFEIMSAAGGGAH